MIVQMTVGLSGPAFSLEPGEQRDFPRDEALRLVSAGHAIPVVTEPMIERAVAVPVVEYRKRKHRG